MKKSTPLLARASLILLSLTTLLVLVPLPSRAQDKLTQEDITTLLEAGSTSDEIIASLSKLGYTGATDQPALAALKKAGASVALLLAVKNSAVPQTSPSNAPAPAPAPTAPEKPFDVWEDCMLLLAESGRNGDYPTPAQLKYLSPGLREDILTLRAPHTRATTTGYTQDQLSRWYDNFEAESPSDELGKEHAPELQKKIQALCFEGDNAAILKRIQEDWLANVYAKMEAESLIPAGLRQCLILLPEPTLSEDKAQKQMTSFIHHLSQKALSLGTTVVIVTTPYGEDTSNPSEDITTEYEKEATQGALLIDSIPGGHPAPCALLFRHGRPVAEGFLPRWVEAPEAALATLTRENLSLTDFTLNYSLDYDTQQQKQKLPEAEVALKINRPARGLVRAGDPFEFISVDRKTGQSSLRQCFVKSISLRGLPLNIIAPAFASTHEEGYLLTIRSADGRSIDTDEIGTDQGQGMAQLAGSPGALTLCSQIEGRITWRESRKIPVQVRGILVADELSASLQAGFEVPNIVSNTDDLGDFSFSANGKAGGTITVTADTSGPVTISMFRPVLTAPGATIQLLAPNTNNTRKIHLGTLTVTRATP